MESARHWLEAGNALDKRGQPNTTVLSAHNDICDEALAHLRAIQNEISERGPDPGHEELIAIAVDDMKIVTALMKLVVVYGIYPLISDETMIPLQPRIAGWKLPPKHQSESVDLVTLRKLSDTLLIIVLKGDDLSRLLLVSPFLADLVAATSFFPPELQKLLERIPTFNLYKILIQLRALRKPQPAIIQSLGELPIRRRDAVRTLIELVIEPKTNENDEDFDFSNSDKAAQVLASIPSTVSKVPYIQSVGTQLFLLLTGSAGPGLAKAAALVIARLSEIQPRFLGELRNMLVQPFETSGASASSALAALLQLAETRESQHSGLFTHIAVRTCSAIWLLVIASNSKNNGELNSAYLALLARTVETSTETSIGAIIASFTAHTVPKTRLEWTDVAKNQPTLLDTVTSEDRFEEQQTLLQLIDARLDVLVTVLAKVDDATATSVLIFLLQSYTNSSAVTSDPFTGVVFAKTIERLAKDVNLRPKLFSDPDQIILLAFRLISANLTSSQASTEPKLASLNISEDADSDDEDSDVEMGNEIETSDSDDNESLSLIELSLSLLGSALMESLGSSEHSQPQISSEQLGLLNELKRNSSKSVRSKADFCLQLIDGSNREQKEVDMENDTEVLAAAQSALKEPLVPSRAYGLYLLTKLLERHAVALDVAMAAFLEELKDDDSYVYLNAIKGIETAARVGDSSKVLDLLIPAINSKKASLDVSLRAREALVRIISPGTAMRVSTQLVDTLLEDLRASSRKVRDIRFRLSSCSILGIIISLYPHALTGTQENDAADCALGILRYEHDPEEQPLQKAAVILALEIVNAANEDAFAAGLAKSTLSSLTTQIESLMHHTDDQVLLEHCRAVMDAAKPII